MGSMCSEELLNCKEMTTDKNSLTQGDFGSSESQTKQLAEIDFLLNLAEQRVDSKQPCKKDVFVVSTPKCSVMKRQEFPNYRNPRVKSRNLR